MEYIFKILRVLPVKQKAMNNIIKKIKEVFYYWSWFRVFLYLVLGFCIIFLGLLVFQLITEIN